VTPSDQHRSHYSVIDVGSLERHKRVSVARIAVDIIVEDSGIESNILYTVTFNLLQKTKIRVYKNMYVSE
jgi:hypothetical protein